MEEKNTQPTTATGTLMTELGRKQTVAGTVVGGVRQPQLTEEERQQIVSAGEVTIDEATKSALKRQGIAGIGGEPQLTPEEMRLIIEHNERLAPRH